jgi:hypothetical protein
MTSVLSRRITPAAGSKLIISLPTHEGWLRFPILVYWLMGWIFGELATVNELNQQGLKNGSAFFLIWAVLWTAGGGYALLDLFWQVWGRQDLIVESTFLTHRRGMFGLGWSKRYELAHMRNVRVVSRPRPGRYDSVIAFDYDTQTIRIGSDMDELEAKQIAHTVRKYVSI